MTSIVKPAMIFAKLTLVGAVFALSGCLEGATLPKIDTEKSNVLSGNTQSGALLQELPVLSGAAKVASPKGYCVDRAGVQDNGRVAFVPMASCATLTGDTKAPAPKAPAVLSATLMPMSAFSDMLPSDPDERMASARSFLESDSGRAVMSWSGQSADLTIQNIDQKSGAIYVQVEDRSAGLPSQLSKSSRRAFFEVGDMLVTGSVTGFADSNLTAAQAQSTLGDLVKALKAANGTAKTGGSGLGAVLGRLRN